MAKNTPSMTVIKPIQFTSGAFSRATSATYINEDGDRVEAAPNVARVGYGYHDYTGDLEYIGPIIEGESRNYISSDINNSDHWDENAQETVAVGSQLRPDGTTGTVYSIEGNSYSPSSMENLETIPPGTYVFSAYIKSPPSTMGIIELFIATGDLTTSFAHFSSDGLLMESGNGNPTIDNAGRGWHRVSITGYIGPGATVYMRVEYSMSATATYGRVMVTDLQLEPYTGSYLPTSFMTDTGGPPAGALTWRAADTYGAPPYVVDINMPFDDYDAWDNGEPYVIGSNVTIPSTHQNYRALTNNTDKFPPDNPLDWLYTGPSNAWRMLTMTTGADVQTENLELIQVTLNPGDVVDAVILLNCEGVSAQVVEKIGETVIYDETRSLLSLPSNPSPWAWHFGERQAVKNVIIMPLPPRRGTTITIRVSSYEGQMAKIGKAIVGRSHRLGFSIYGASAGITSYSTKSTDTFGNTKIVPRRFVGKMDLTVVLDRNIEDFTHRKLSELKDVPAVYIGHDNYDCLLILGFYNDFRVLFGDAASSYLSLSVTGI